MLNQTGIKRASYGNRKTILVDPENSTAVSCIISDSGVTEDEDGVKMVKAGTPVYGSLLERDKAMTVTSGAGSSICGVILHDVEVTDGPANSQIVIFGTIDVSKLEDDVATSIKAAESSLKMIQLIAP